MGDLTVATHDAIRNARYTVRAPGCAAYAGSGLTRLEAIRDCYEGMDAGLNVGIVMDGGDESRWLDPVDLLLPEDETATAPDSQRIEAEARSAALKA